MPSSSMSTTPTTTASSDSKSFHLPHTHRIEWEYEPSEEELISAHLRDEANASGGDALVGPLGAKAIASVTGAVSTSLLMTPFDVLKTRLQTVRPSTQLLVSPEQVTCCQLDTSPPFQHIRLGEAGPGPKSAVQRAAAAAAAAASRPPSYPSTQSHVPAVYQVNTSTAGSATLFPRAPEGCIHPSKWSGIWGELVTPEEAERIQCHRGGLSANPPSTVSQLGQQARQGAQALRGKLLGGARGGGPAGGGFFSEIGVILSEPAGWRGLWKGVGTGLVMSIPSASIYMLGYEYLLGIISSQVPGSTTTTKTNVPVHIPGRHTDATMISQHTPLNVGGVASTRSTPTTTTLVKEQQAYLSPAPFLAGSMARTMSATIISPIELFRTRLQALPAPGQAAPTYASTFASITEMVKTQGIHMLWRGLGPTLWRDVPFSGLYWAGFESLKRYFSESQLISPGVGMTFTSGALSGMLASLVTSPFDVLKTRRQVFTPSKSCSQAALSHPASTLPLLGHIIKTEGWKALFAGVVPRTVKVAPACGMMIAAYEGVGRLLGGKQAER